MSKNTLSKAEAVGLVALTVVAAGALAVAPAFDSPGSRFEAQVNAYCARLERQGGTCDPPADQVRAQVEAESCENIVAAGFPSCAEGAQQLAGFMIATVNSLTGVEQ